MKKEIHLIITFLGGISLIIAFFVPNPKWQSMGDTAQSWAIIVFSFAVILGLVNLFISNMKKILNKQKDWQYNAVLLAGFIVTAVVGFAKGMGTGSPFDFIVQNIFVQLNATVFSLLAFFIASAAFRAFKARSFEATLLLLAAILVMLGRVPIGDYLIERSAYLFKTMNFDSGFNFVMKIKASKIAEWIV